jgi:6-phosphofructokinase 1
MNSVISAVTIEAINSGWEVVGILDGFEHLIEGRTDHVVNLGIGDVSRIHPSGGTILYTSRANPTILDDSAEDTEWRLHACLGALRELDINALVTIGGEDTAYSATRLAQEAAGRIKVAHVPKTIDNDLPLPNHMPTFGFQTARHVGVNLVTNLMTDAQATKRWFVVVAMGRSAGHLALGITKAAGATVAVIGEEFPSGEEISLRHLVDIVECSMLKRIAHGRPFGVAVIAEGIGLRLPKDELEEAAPDLERDEHGHVRLTDLNLHRVVVKLLKDRFKARGQRAAIVAKNIGYELRSAPPIPFDIDYTKDLGWGAVNYLRELLGGGGDDIGAMITLQEGNLVPMPFGSFTDPVTGKIKVRTVDTSGTAYQVAREYMIRLEREDIEDEGRLSAIAEAAKMTPEEFRDRYGYLVA